MLSQIHAGLKEVKAKELRVALIPSVVSKLLKTKQVKAVWIEFGAGIGSGFPDSDYIRAGAVMKTAEEIWSGADVIYKVKEPQPSEYQCLILMAGKTLITYLHLAGSPIELTRALLRNNITAIAYETVADTTADGRTIYPLLIPMSVIAGEQAALAVLKRHKSEAYRNLETVVVAVGNVGEAALRIFLASGVRFITCYEWSPERITQLITKYASVSERVAFLPLKKLDAKSSRDVLKHGDGFVCGPMVPGGEEAPIVMTQLKHFRYMKPGTLVVDVSIDQGGSTEATKGNPTKPGETFTRWKVVFSATPNIPGSTVPERATKDLAQATLPYYLEMGERGAIGALKVNPRLRLGLQTHDGSLVNLLVAKKLGLMDEHKNADVLFV